MLFVGVDPSLKHTGLVILHDDSPEPLLARMCEADPTAQGLARCIEIEKSLCGAIAEVRSFPLFRGVGGELRIAIEHYSYGAKFNVVDLVQLGTTIRLGFVRRGWRFSDPAPGQVKKFVSMPKARWKKKPKEEVQKLWGYKAKNGDIADAYVLAQIARASSTRVANLTEDQRDVVLACRTGHFADTAEAA